MLALACCTRVVDDLGLGNCRAWAGNDDGVDRLAPSSVGNAEHCRFLYSRVCVDRVLDFSAVHILAAGNDHVFSPINK